MLLEDKIKCGNGKIEVLEHDSLKPTVAPLKKAAKNNEESIPSRRGKRRNGTSANKLKDNTTMTNTTEKPADIGKALALPILERPQTSMTN